MSAPDSPVGPLRYLVSHNSEVKGPFDLDMIEAFILNGHYPRGVRICAVGSKEWRSYLPPIPTSPAPASGQSDQSPVVKTAGSTPKWIFIVAGAIRSVPRCKGWGQPEMDLYCRRGVCASRARCGLEWDHKRDFDRIFPNWICNQQLCSAANV